MPRFLLVLGLVAALVAGCSGKDASKPEEASLARAAVKEAVATALKKAGFEAEPGFGARVRAQDGPNWVEVGLEAAVREYRKDPDRRDAIVAAVVRDTRERLEDGISGLSFADARPSILPLLKARFVLRTLDQPVAETAFVAGLAVIYAVQREDDFTLIAPEDIRRWGRPLAQIDRLAIANLLRRTNRDEKLLCEPSGGSELCGWASGDGYDATRMIVPGLRRQIEREYDAPAVYAVPTENVFVALPLSLATRKNTEQLLRIKVRRDFTTGEKPVSPELFVERGGKLVVFGA
jgi:uncharacterized protein YtpQ (UPF0354 family)